MGPRTIEGGRRPSYLDALVAVGVFVAQVAGSLIEANSDPGSPQLRWWGVAEVAVACAALVFRRRAPFIVLQVVGIMAAAYGISEQPDPPLQLALLVALFTAGQQLERRLLVVVGVITTIGAVASTVAAGDSGLDDYYIGLLPCLVALVLGERSRTRTLYLAEVELRAEELERDRLAAVERAAADERTRIARELHDVVAHHVSMMVVQAEAGAAQAGGGGAGEAAFDAISATGRTAMAELRRLLGVLREDGGAPLTEPQPGVDQIGDLVLQVRDAGLDVGLSIVGPQRPLPAGIDVSAYRIVQEGLTNALRHGDGGGATTVAVQFGPTSVDVEICNPLDRRAPDGPPPRNGRGLVGMRERVHLLGGELDAGPTGDGRFLLHARLPHLPSPSPEGVAQ
jgi:signal transduction histidine kinase